MILIMLFIILKILTKAYFLSLIINKQICKYITAKQRYVI